MFSSRRRFAGTPVDATVMSNTLAMAVPIEPSYSVWLPNTILSAAIRACLFAGPARRLSHGLLSSGCSNSTASPTA